MRGDQKQKRKKRTGKNMGEKKQRKEGEEKERGGKEKR